MEPLLRHDATDSSDTMAPIQRYRQMGVKVVSVFINIHVYMEFMSLMYQNIYALIQNAISEKMSYFTFCKTFAILYICKNV